MIAKYLPFLLSAVTIWMTLMAGNKHPKAWAVGLVNQALWLVWIVSTSAWVLLPMNIALWVVYGRNHFKWGKQDTHPEPFGRCYWSPPPAPEIHLDLSEKERTGDLLVLRPDRALTDEQHWQLLGDLYTATKSTAPDVRIVLLPHCLQVVGGDMADAIDQACRLREQELPSVHGDVLPQVGDKVLIHLGRSERWVEHTVVGYYVWKGLGGDDSLHRVFVRVKSADGYLNARMLKDVRPITPNPEEMAA